MTPTAGTPTKLSRAQARRVALAAQGFGGTRRVGLERPVGFRDVGAVIRRLGQFQIDSVNVVTRAHHVPLYSRLGPYDLALLQRAAGKPPRKLFEYWAHAASLVDVELQPLLRWRMRRHHPWVDMGTVAAEHPDLVDRVLAELADRGPLTAREIELTEVRDKSNWGWNWSSVKIALEWLFYAGEVTVARRNSQFERVYDLPERVFPAAVLAAPTPTPEESVLGLVRHAARALGVASEVCLADYFRTKRDVTRMAIAALERSGELIPVEVEGWRRPCWLWHEATVPRRLHARALLCPFDSLVFERDRVEALFEFFYRIEIYVPEPKRVHGYYVFPFLLGDRLVGRVDLKADRAAGLLRVRSAWTEGHPDLAPAEIAAELLAELELMASWLGLDAVDRSGATGDLAPALAYHGAG